MLELSIHVQIKLKHVLDEDINHKQELKKKQMLETLVENMGISSRDIELKTGCGWGPQYAYSAKRLHGLFRVHSEIEGETNGVVNCGAMCPGTLAGHSVEEVGIRTQLLRI